MADMFLVLERLLFLWWASLIFMSKFSPGNATLEAERGEIRGPNEVTTKYSLRVGGGLGDDYERCVPTTG